MTTNVAAEVAEKKAATKTPAKRPTNVKAPQDHKPAATAKAEAEGVAVVTVHAGGRDWEVDSNALGDFELLEHIDNMERGGQAAVMSSPRVLRAMLGGTQMTEAMALLRDPDTGKVDIGDGVSFVAELLGGYNPNS